MEAKFYYKKRKENDIKGPNSLEKILDLEDDVNVQISNFKDVNWVWLNEYKAKTYFKKNKIC